MQSGFISCPMASHCHFLLYLVVLSSVCTTLGLSYVRMDLHDCRRMCSLEGHTPSICAAECWWPQMHVESERLCHKACRIRKINDDDKCRKLCLNTPIKQILTKNAENSGGFGLGPSNGGNCFGRVKNHYAEIRVAKGKRIGIGKKSELLLPAAGLLPETLSAPDWGAQDCKCKNPVGPTRLQFGLMGGSASRTRGKDSVRIEGWLCPNLGCFYEKEIPPPANLQYNIPVRVEWRATVTVRPATKKSEAKTKQVTRSVVMTFRKKGDFQFTGPIRSGDTIIRCNLDGKPLTHRMQVKTKYGPGFSFFGLPSSETRQVQMESLTIKTSEGGVLRGPNGCFTVPYTKKVPHKKEKHVFRTVSGAKTFCYTIIDPLSVVLDGTKIN